MTTAPITPSTSGLMTPEDALRSIHQGGAGQDTRSGHEIARQQFSGVTFNPHPAPAAKAAAPTDAEVMASLSNDALTMRAMLIMGGMSKEDANARAIASDQSKLSGRDLAALQFANTPETQNPLQTSPSGGSPPVATMSPPPASASPPPSQMTPEEALRTMSGASKQPGARSGAETAKHQLATSPKAPASNLTQEEKLATVAQAMMEEPGAWLGNATGRGGIKAAASSFLATEAPGLSKKDRETVAGYLAEQEAKLRADAPAAQPVAPAPKPATTTPAATLKPAMATPAAPTGLSAAGLPSPKLSLATAADPTTPGAKTASTGIRSWLERKLKLARFTSGTC